MQNKSLLYKQQNCYGGFHLPPQTAQLWLFIGERIYKIVLEVKSAKAAALKLSDKINHIRLTS
jgi:hypothetical protein